MNLLLQFCARPQQDTQDKNSCYIELWTCYKTTPITDRKPVHVHGARVVSAETTQDRFCSDHILAKQAFQSQERQSS